MEEGGGGGLVTTDPLPNRLCISRALMARLEGDMGEGLLGDGVVGGVGGWGTCLNLVVIISASAFCLRDLVESLLSIR